MPNHRKLTQVIAVLLSCLTFINTAFAAKLETDFWTERSRHFTGNASVLPKIRDQQSTISPLIYSRLNAFGSIRGISKPRQASKGTVWFIQDVHMNGEAQANISHAVSALIDDGAESVALEGAFQTLSLETFRNFPDRNAINRISDYFLRLNKISGALHAAINSEKTVPVVGIDDERAYQENVAAYRACYPQINRMKSDHAAEMARVQTKKRETFNPKLLAFDEEVESYRSGHARIGRYLKVLASHAPEVPPIIRNFLEAFDLEIKMDFSKVEQERRQWLRAGRSTLDRYPLLSDYVRYARLSEQMSAESLLSEAKVLEQADYARLARIEAERALIERSREIFLATKLADFSLSAEEWQEYSSLSQSFDGMANFENFYREAGIRDEKMAENFLRQTRGHRSQALNSKNILVTGGFHSGGITRRLVDEGFTVVSFVPRISQIDASSGSSYLTAFAQEKAPLAKLFEGAKLFLAPLQTANLTELYVDGAADAGVKTIPPLIIENRKLEGDSISAEVRNSQTGAHETVQIEDNGVEIKNIRWSDGIKPASLLHLALTLPAVYEKIFFRFGPKSEKVLRWIGGLWVPIEGITLTLLLMDNGVVFQTVVFTIFVLSHVVLFISAGDEVPRYQLLYLFSVATLYVLPPLFPETIGPWRFVVPLLHFLLDIPLIRLPLAPLGTWEKDKSKLGRDILLRPMRRWDLKVIEKNEPPQREGNHIHWRKNQLRDSLRMDNGLVAIFEGQIVGYAFFGLEFAGTSRLINIANIAVLKHERSKGIGGLLLKHVEAVAREKKADAILTYFDRGYVGIRDFFQKKGFRENSPLVDGKVNVFVRSISSEGSGALFQDIFKRDMKRERFFSFLGFLNAIWWIRQEHFKTEDPEEKIFDRGLKEKEELDFYHNHPNPAAVYGWTDILFYSAVHIVSDLIGKRLNEELRGGRSKLEKLTEEERLKLKAYCREFALPYFLTSIDDDASGNYGFSIILALAGFLAGAQPARLDAGQIGWHQPEPAVTTLEAPLSRTVIQASPKRARGRRIKSIDGVEDSISNFGNASTPKKAEAIVLELEALPLEMVPDPESGKSIVQVRRDVRELIRQYAKEGRAVAIISEAPFEVSRSSDRETGLRPMFLYPFMQDLEEESGDTDWLSNIKLFPESSGMFEITEFKGNRLPEMPRFTLRRLTSQPFLNSLADFKIINRRVQELGLRLRDGGIGFDHFRFEINFSEVPSAKALEDLKGTIRRHGGSRISFVSKHPKQLLVKSSSYQDALEWFSNWAIAKRGQALHDVVIVDRGTFRDLKNLKVVERFDEPGITHYAFGRNADKLEGSANEKLIKGTTAHFFETAHSILGLVNETHRKKSGTLNGDLWRQSNGGLDARTVADLSKKYGNNPPTVIMSELNRSLISAGKKVTDKLLDDILDFLALDPNQNRFGVFTVDPIDGNTTVYTQFLDPLLERATQREQLSLLENLTVYAEGGASKILFDPNHRRFEEKEALPLKLKRSDRDRIISVLKRYHVSIRPNVLDSERSYQLQIKTPEGQGKNIDAIVRILNATLGEKFRVALNGHDVIVINRKSKEEAALDFIQDLKQSGVSRDGYRRPLILTSFFATGDHAFEKAQGEGFVCSHRELGKAFSETEFHFQRIEKEEIPSILLGHLEGKVLAYQRPIAPNDTPPKKPGTKKNGRQTLIDNGLDSALPSTFDSFHALPDLQDILANPPRDLYLVSGGGGGDVKTVAMLAATLLDVFKRHRENLARKGQSFSIPRIKIVDSNLKHKLENTYGGPVPMEKLFYRAADGSEHALKHYSINRREAKHFYLAHPDMFVRYGLPDENKKELPFMFEFEWSYGKAYHQLKELGVEVLIADSIPSPNDMAKDLVSLHGGKKKAAGVMLCFPDVGGDVAAKLNEIQSHDSATPESLVRSATTDTNTIATAVAMRRAGIKRTVIAIAGSGADGELFTTLPRYLKEFLMDGTMIGAWDLVHYFLSRPTDDKPREQILQWALDLPILTESSRVFIESLLNEVRQGRDSYFVRSTLTSLKEKWRRWLSPHTKILPQVPLRSGTRPGLLVSPAVFFLNPDLLFNRMVLPVPIEDHDGSISYRSGRDELMGNTWHMTDELFHAAGHTTESNERDHHANSIKRSYKFMLSVFRGQTSGLETGSDNGSWRVTGLNPDPLHYFDYAESTLVRLAAFGALGPDFWEETEPLIWEIYDRTNNAFLKGQALAAIADAGQGKTSKHWDRILATAENPLYKSNFTVDLTAGGIDTAMIQDGARLALAALRREEPSVKVETKKSLKTERKKSKRHEARIVNRLPVEEKPQNPEIGRLFNSLLQVSKGRIPETHLGFIAETHGAEAHKESSASWGDVLKTLFSKLTIADVQARPSISSKAMDETYMRRALVLALKAKESASGLSAHIGAMIVDQDRIIGEGYNAGTVLHAEHEAIFKMLTHLIKKAELDPTKRTFISQYLYQLEQSSRLPMGDRERRRFIIDRVQPSLILIKDILVLAKSYPTSPVMYVTTEPCATCPHFLVPLGFKRVVFGAHKLNGGGSAWLRSHGVIVDGGVLDQESRLVQKGYWILTAKFPRLQSLFQRIVRANAKIQKTYPWAPWTNLYRRALVRQSYWAGAIAMLGGFIEDFGVRLLIQGSLAWLFGPTAGLFIFALLFAFPLHSKILKGKNPILSRPTLKQKLALLLLSVGFGAGGYALADGITAYLFMGIFHAAYNFAAHHSGWMLGMAGGEAKEFSEVALDHILEQSKIKGRFSDIVENGFENILEPFTFEAALHGEAAAQKRERSDAIETLSKVFGKDDRLVRLLQIPRTFVIFFDRKIKEQGIQIENVPRPDLVIASVNKSNGHHDHLIFTFVDIKNAPHSKEARIKFQIDPDATGVRKANLAQIFRTMMKFKKEPPISNGDAIRRLTKIVLDPINKLFPDVDFNQDVRYELKKGFFVAYAASSNHDLKYAMVDASHGQRILVKRAYQQIVEEFAQLFNISGDLLAQSWMEMQGADIGKKIIEPAIAIATLTKSIQQKTDFLSEIRSLELWEVPWFLRQAGHLILANRLDVPELKDGDIPGPMVIENLLRALLSISSLKMAPAPVPPKKPLGRSDSLILESPSYNKNIQSIDGDVFPIVQERKSHVLVFLTKDGQEKMRSVLDGLLEENGATGPESISIFAEPGVGYSEKLKKVKKNSPVKIQIFIRKELTSEKTISLKKVLVYFGEDAHIKEFKDTRFDRIYVTEDKLIDTNEEVPEQFNETIVMIFGAMGRAIAASVEQLKTRMDEIRAALTGA